MEWNKEALNQTLKWFEFDKHRSHRWLLAKRERREAILHKAGLLEILQDAEDPRLLGTLVRSEQEYDWGHVRFRSRIGKLDVELPCSIYAAFEYLIRHCTIFPMYISLSDVRRCGTEGMKELPIYGSSFTLRGIPRQDHGAVISRMLQLHNVQRRRGLLVDQTVEITDNELFALYFENNQQKEPVPQDTNEGTGLDDIDVWHT